MKVLKLLEKLKPCPVLLRRVGKTLAEGIYCGGPIGACVEVADLEAIRAKEAIGDLRRCHVVDIDVMDGRMLVITWDWGNDPYAIMPFGQGGGSAGE